MQFSSVSKGVASAPWHLEVISQHRIVEIACGRFHSLALSASGEVFSWGSGSLGRLGYGVLDQSTPKQVFLSGSQPLLGWRPHVAELHLKEEHQQELQQIACGGQHSAAVEPDGSCWLWGSGEYGQNGSQKLEERGLRHHTDWLVHITCVSR